MHEYDNELHSLKNKFQQRRRRRSLKRNEEVHLFHFISFCFIKTSFVQRSIHKNNSKSKMRRKNWTAKLTYRNCKLIVKQINCWKKSWMTKNKLKDSVNICTLEHDLLKLNPSGQNRQKKTVCKRAFLSKIHFYRLLFRRFCPLRFLEPKITSIKRPRFSSWSSQRSFYLCK